MAVRADDVDLLRDRALVERFQAGDEEGFEDLYRRYFPRLLRFCMKRLGNQHEAEEVAQEAFVKALKAMPQLQGERRFYPWLTVIASRLCVDSHRRQGRSEPTAEIDLGVIDGGQEAIVEATDLVLLAQAMDRLSSRHREVLDLREHKGWTYQQISAHLDCTQGTVEALLFRARRSLRKEFQAVAGDGRLAALPVLGWLHRKVANLAERVALWPGSQLAPYAANAFSAVVVAGAVAVGAIAAGSAAPVPTVGGNAGRPEVVALAAGQTPSVLVVPESPSPGQAGSPAALRPAPANPRPGATPSAPPVKFVVGEDAARRRASDQPVNAGTDAAVVGIDPAAPARVLANTVEYLGGPK